MTVIIMVILLMCSFWPVSAAGEQGTDNFAKTSEAEYSTGSDNGQVIVLYEDGFLEAVAGRERIAISDGIPKASQSADNGGAAEAQGSADPAEPEIIEAGQEAILDEALGDDYSIDDTIVLEAADEAEDSMVLGVVSSDSYSTEELADVLQNTAGIRYAEPNYIFRASSLPAWNDSYFKDEWHLGTKGINLDRAPAAARGTLPIVIAVMDSGIAYDHPDLHSRMWTAPASLDEGGAHGKDCADRDNDPYDDNGHGTHCAGIIAAAADNSEGIAGITGKSDFRLMAVRVLDADGIGLFTDIIKGYDYLIKAKKSGTDVRVVNCSFGCEGKSSLLDSVIDQAGSNGILTVAAAGNESVNNDTHEIMPANSSSSYVISVAACDDNGGLASYSNFGRNKVDIAAPGSNILSTVSYYNYAPFLYNASQLRATTEVYGEFGGAVIGSDPLAGGQSVTPVTGTDHSGKEITGVATFGGSRMYSVLNNGSRGQMSLSITDGSDFGRFPVGNNQKCLRWTIRNAGYGDKYILYFPYSKTGNAPYTSIVFRTHTDLDQSSSGALHIGDVKVSKNSQGKIQYSVSGDSSDDALDIDKTWNSIWQSSGMEDILYDTGSVSGLAYGTYGLGFVYESWASGDVILDISSLAISDNSPDEEQFGKYDIFSGTSEATPVVSGAAGLIAAANPGISPEILKETVLRTSGVKSALTGKCVTGAAFDFAAYRGPASSGSAVSGNTAVMVMKSKFTWNGKKLTSKVKVLIHKALSKSKTPKKFSVRKKNGKAVLKWKKVKGVNGYIIFRKTGSGRFRQIKKLSSAKKGGYTDKTVKKGKKYQYLVVSYKKVPGTKAVRISPATKTKKFRK